jgi:hypothetical protein
MQAPQWVGPQSFEPARQGPASGKHASESVRCLDRIEHRRHTGRCPQCRDEGGTSVPVDVGRLAVAAMLGEPSGDSRDVGQ